MATGSNKGLQFKLGLSVLQAKKDVKDFVRWANREGRKLNIATPGVSPGGRGGGGGGGRGGGSAVPEESQRLKQIEKMRSDFYSKMIQAETRNGKKVAHLREKAEKELNEIIRTSHGREMSQTKRHLNELMTAYTTHSRKHIQNEKRTGKDLIRAQQQEQKKRLSAVKKHEEDIVTAVKNSDAALRRQELTSGRENTELKQRYLMERQKILDNYQAHEVRDVRRHLSVLRAEYQRSTQMANQAAQHHGKASSRAMNTLFNVNQAVEDFAFAGLRGAANNLSVMASMMGGPTGVIALIGLMGVSIYHLGEALDWWGSKTDEQNDKLKQQLSLLSQLHKTSTQREFDFRRSGGGDMSSQVEEMEESLNILPDQIKETEKSLARDKMLLDQLKALKESRETIEKLGMAEAAGAAVTFGGSIPTGEFDSTVRSHARLISGIKKQFPEMRGSDMAMWDTKELENAIKFQRQEVRGATESLAEYSQELRDTKDNIKVAKEHARLWERLTKETGDTFSFGGVETGGLEKLSKTFKSHVAERNRALKVTQEFAQNRHDELFELGKFEKAEELLRKTIKSLQTYREEQEEILQNEKERFNFLGASYAVTKDLTAQAERQVQLAERKVRTIEKEIAALKRAKQQSQFGFEAQMFGAESSIIDKMASHQAQTLKARDARRLRMMFGNRPGVDQLIQRRAAVIDRRVEHNRERQQSKLRNERLGVLNDRAAGQAQAGDFAQARGTLTNVRSMLMSASNAASSPREAVMFLNKVREVQERIQALYDKQMKAKEQEKQDTQQILHDAKTLASSAAAFRKSFENTNFDPMKANLNSIHQKMLDMVETAKGLNRALGGDAEMPSVPGVPTAMATPALPGAIASRMTNNTSTITNNFNATVNTGGTNTDALMRDLMFKGKGMDLRMS